MKKDELTLKEQAVLRKNATVVLKLLKMTRCGDDFTDDTNRIMRKLKTELDNWYFVR